MATKSINKSVKIRDKETGQMLFNAIESSCRDSDSKVVLKCTPQRVDRKDIKDFFRKSVK